MNKLYNTLSDFLGFSHICDAMELGVRFLLATVLLLTFLTLAINILTFFWSLI